MLALTRASLIMSTSNQQADRKKDMSINNCITYSEDIKVTEKAPEGSYKLETTANHKIHVKIPAGSYKAGDMIPVAVNVREEGKSRGRRSLGAWKGYTVVMHKCEGLGKVYFDSELKKDVQNCYFD